MNELVVIAEGPTELAFVNSQLAGHLAIHGTIAWPVLPGRHRNQGGVKKWEVAQQDIVRTLREKRHCSTMFDYYAMPNDWPGRAAAESLPWRDRAQHIQDEMAEDIRHAMGDSWNPKYFIPYVQLHEFEALAFADIEALVSVISPLTKSSEDDLTLHFDAILRTCGHPEAINDRWETCPSRRITTEVPAYRKPLHGPIITKRIGLDVLRSKCDHFATWINTLEQLK